MKPNILMIMTDQHRYDGVSYLGDKLPATPHLDQVANEGIVFTNAYTPSPVCAPARAAIKSGMYPPGCGVINNWLEFKTDTELLTHRLVRQGYTTGLCGKLHFVPHQNDFGFEYKTLNDAPYSTYADDDRYSIYVNWLREHYFDAKGIDPVQLFDEDEESYDDNIYKFCMGSDFRQEEEHDIPWTVDESIAFLEQRNQEKPFFLFTSFFGPHQPYMPPSPWKEMYPVEDIQLPPQFHADMHDNPIFQYTLDGLRQKLLDAYSTDDYKRILSAYYGQISMIDHYMGRLLEYLREHNLWDNTMIIFVSDHGDYMGAYDVFFKGQMYDACCKVPMLIKPPYYEREASVREEIVNSLDLYGTILDVAGDSSWRNEQIEARSLEEFFSNDSIQWDNKTYSIIGDQKEHNLTMIRKDNMKLMRQARGEEAPLYELYDMTDQVVEVRNVYDHESYSDIREELKAELDTWWAFQGGRYPDHVISHLRNRSKGIN